MSIANKAIICKAIKIQAAAAIVINVRELLPSPPNTLGWKNAPAIPPRIMTSPRIALVIYFKLVSFNLNLYSWIVVRI